MDMLFSTELEEYKQELPLPIREAVIQIKNYFSIHEDLKILKYGKDSIAIPVTFTVPLPQRKGAVGGIDIREKEPMLVGISISQYPYETPLLLSDRRNFPKKRLPHLYVSKEDEPAKLCLIRNNPNEWFANKNITDLLAVGEQWLFKAAIGKLVDDGDEFDPLRLESYAGYHIYQYSQLLEIVNQKLSFVPEQPFALLLSYVYKNDYQHGIGLTYRSLSAIQFIQLPDTLKLLHDLQSKVSDSLEGLPLLSILIWQQDHEIENEYSTFLPDSYGTLKVYFQGRGVDIDKILNTYITAGCHLRNGIPVIYAIKRPKKMVGYDGKYEFINFLISAKDFTSNSFSDDTTVTVQAHIEPLTKELSTKVSGEDRDVRTLFVGAGSLGSKVIVHDARSGKICIGAVDDDKLLQHNLIRHALFNNMVGVNKAKAIIKQISDMFEGEPLRKFTAYPGRVHNLKKEIFNNYDWLVDSTAGVDVLNWLSVQDSLPDSVQVSRCELADDGRLGLLYIEGKNRNPRIDDLVNLAYFEAIKNPSLEGWRKRDANRELTNLSVGLGCSSTTSILPDDTISLYASVFSKTLHKTRHRETIEDNGLFYLSVCSNEPLLSTNNEYQVVKPFELYSCSNESGWQVRMLNGITAKLFSLCKEKGKTETGGVLIGVSNYKTKTIHVFDIITEPQDSKGCCNGFVRGTKGLPEKVDFYKEKTGNIIGYVGEWHTHPMDLETLSARDRETINELVPINRKEPIPTCALIVTNNKILPFVFE